jgi:hypothetical protein
MKKSAVKVKRMDRRMSGNHLMKYQIDFSISAGTGYTRFEFTEEFYRVFRWCEEQYGATRCLEDLEFAIDGKSTAADANPSWSFIRDQWRTKILFAEKEQAAHYTLVWGI